jgi:hypothetical protein
MVAQDPSHLIEFLCEWVIDSGQLDLSIDDYIDEI